MANVTADSWHYIAPTIERFTREPDLRRGIHVNLPGGGGVVSWNGTTYKVPRGLVQTDFRPRIGNRNLVNRPPMLPLTTAPHATPVPASTGLVIRFAGIYAGAIVGLQLLADLLIASLPAIYRQFKIQEDVELMNSTLTSPNPNAEVLRQRIRDKTLTKKGIASAPRRRIHGYSRR